MSVSLEVEGLVAGYAAVEVLHGVTLRVDPGETVALLGRNGAGKTTLLRSVFGSVRPSAGSVRLDGREVARTAPYRMSRLGVGYVPEDRGLFLQLSVLENLRLATLRQGGDDQAIEAAMELFPVLRGRAASAAATLSGGEQQMLALGRAMVSGPRLLLLDEPFLGLAPKMVENVREALVGLAGSGVSILLVEQNARLALSLASRAYLLSLGRVEAESDADRIARDPRLATAYLSSSFVDPDRRPG